MIGREMGVPLCHGQARVTVGKAGTAPGACTRARPRHPDVWTVSYLIRHPLERDAQDLIDRGLAQEDLGEAVLGHRFHPGRDGCLAKRGAITAVHDQRTRALVHLEHFEDTQSTAEPAPVALRASGAAEEADPCERIVRGAEDAL